MARQVFTVNVSHATLTAAKNLLVLTTPATKQMQVLSASLTNSSNEISAQLQIGIYAVTVAGTGGATAVTPMPVEIASAGTSLVTCEHTYVTTEPTLAAASHLESFNNQVGWLFSPKLLEALRVPVSTGICFRIPTASFSSTSFDLRVTYCSMTVGDAWYE